MSAPEKIDKTSVSDEVSESDKNTDIIEKCIGSLGRWQIIVFLVLSTIKIPAAWHQMNIVFIAPPANFTCLDSYTSRCSSSCTQYSFDRSIFTETIVTEWNLVCGASQLVNLTQTIAMLGILVGGSFFGYLSDKFGRRINMIAASILLVVSGILQYFVPWFSLFVVLKFLSTTAVGGLMMTSFVMIMEIIGVKWRTTLGVFYQVFYNIGHILMPLISYFLRDWRNFQLAISLVPVVHILFYCFLPESPRWLLSVGENKRAIAVLEKAAKHNKLSSESIKENVENYLSKKQPTKKNSVNVLDLFRTPIIRTYSICIGYNWFAAGLCFFGSFQYIGLLKGDIFLNVALTAIASIPGTLFAIYNIKVWGRKRSLIFANTLSAVFLFVIAAVPPEPSWIRLSLSMVNIFAILNSFTIVYIYAGELFPTPVRNVAVGTASMWARIGSMVAPFIAGLEQDWVAPLVFGITVLIGVFLCLKLPETLDCKLPDTIEEAEELAKMKKKNDVK